MRSLRSVCTVGLCCVMLHGCLGTPRGSAQIYVVRPEDTLYSIAWRHDLDYRELARWNHIGPDYRIAVGQTLVLGPDGTLPAAAPRNGVSSAPTSAQRLPGSAPNIAPGRASDATPQVSAPRPLPAPAPPPSIAGKWVWPTDAAAKPRPVPGGGILLSGRLGQEVRAASAGRVVYTGSGLRGYGNLVIIKHGENLLSAYAHNREMLVHEGQEVATGQVIAHMGEVVRQNPTLYFELRQNGKPIDPLAYLPEQR